MVGKGNEAEENGARAVSSFPRIVEVLYALTATSGLQSVRAIAEVTGNSRSATQRILRSLADTGYAEQREDGSYAVGSRLVELAARVFGVVPVLKLADSVMTELVKELNETCYLGTYGHGDTFTTFIHRVESDHPVRHIQPLGVRLPLHAGAMGKAILSLSDLKLEQLDLTKFTPHTPTTKAALKKDLEQTRQLGYATSFEERVAGVVGVAAPLVAGETVVGGLSVSIPINRVPEEGVEGIGKLVRKRAQELSLALTAMGVKRI
ncbi:MAG TPA: IclR family transcriptional regulator [Ramlibacter sp.]|nr:IclR family transcriptional regulator [Ramlibacter sp.]